MAFGKGCAFCEIEFKVGDVAQLVSVTMVRSNPGVKYVGERKGGRGAISGLAWVHADCAGFEKCEVFLRSRRK